ncbi:MAG: translocation/assembly module TamB [Desulfarculaceae bacterium]|nr:translocation/assembly module TamB [Desulfarculaceae bacterium]MCF8046498.1 translocation/assembly module TamB [Desulfarculaceae bacterium]MCF8064564.1 translocation/assembly module TamB [Desulfarculaceae bacterium]MCF8098574.1 translocation/assembly module TamB [Desulfarculaceae bacterium]MCF8122669.1 translocation/assembly module TamB [Desulfarculaceae bacterium]
MFRGKIHGLWLALGAAALALVLLLSAAWAVGRSDAFRAWLVDEIKAQVAQATGAQLEIRSLDGSLLFNAQAQGLSLAHEGRKVLEVERLELSYNLLSLLGGRIRITSLTALRPRVSLPLPLPSGGDDEVGLALSIKRLKITGGSLEAGEQLGALQSATQVDLDGRLTLDARGLKARAKLHRSLLSVQGLAKPVLLSLESSLDSKRLKLMRLVASSGPNQVELSGEVALAAPHSFKALIKAPRLIAGDLPLDWPLPALPSGPLALELTAGGSMQKITLRGQVSQGVQTLKLDGWLEPQAGAMAFSGRLEQVALADWGLPMVQAKLDGGWSLDSPAWPVDDASLNLELDLDQAAWQKLSAGPVKAKAQLQGNLIMVQGLSLTTPWGRVDAQGSLKLPQGAAPLTLDAQASLHELTPPPGLKLPLPAGLAQAKISGQVRAKGALEDLALELDLDKSQAAPGLEIDSLHAKGRREGGHWRLEEMHLESNLATLDAKGRVYWDQAKLRFKLTVPDMAELIQRLTESKLSPPVALSGALEAKGRLTGSWAHPDLKVELSVGRLFTRHALARQLRLEADIKNLGPHLKGWAQMTAAGWMSGEIFLDRAAVRAEFVDGKEEVLVQGEGPDTGISFKLTSKNLLKLPFKAGLSDLWVRRGTLGRWDQKGAAQIILGSEEVKVSSFELVQGSERVTLSGDFKHTGEIQAGLELDSIKMNHVVGQGTSLPPRSRLDGKATVSGTLGQPTLTIKGKVRDLELEGMDPMSAEFSADYGGERIKIDGRVSYGSHQVLELSGWSGLSVSLRPPVWEPTGEGIHLQATGRELPLALAGSLVPGIREMRGKAQLQLTVGGTFKQPTVAGYLKLNDGSLVVDSTGQQVQKIDLDLTIDGALVSINRAQAVSDGEIKITGSLKLPFRNPGALDLELSSHNLLVVAGDYAQMDVTSQVRLTGDFQRPVISGRVGVSDIGVRLGLSAPAGIEDVVVLKPGQKPPPLEIKDKRFHLPPILNPLKVDLEVSLGDRTRITLDDGWMEATGGLMLKKEPDGPLIFSGVVQVNQGLILLSGRRFDVLGGKVDFAGKNQPNPNLNAEARLQMGSITVFVEVGGTANNPVISLNSLPPMSQADILSTIIFGRPSSELNKGQSKELSAQALALLGQAGQKEMAKLFGADLSPDVVTVHNAPSAGPSLEAGKYLNENLYLRYRQNLGPYGGQNVGLEYRFTRYFAIESTIGNTRDNGVDIVFTRDFDFFREEKKAKTQDKTPTPLDQPEQKTPAQ